MPFYKGPAGFERFMNLFMNLVINLAITAYVLWFVQQHNPGAPILTPLNFCCTFVENFALGVALVSSIPVVNWAQAAGRKAKTAFGSLVLQSLVFDLVLSTLLSIILCTLSNIQTMGPVGTFMSWISVYPVTLVMVFVICLVFMPLFMGLSAKLSGFDPRKLPAGARPGGPGFPGSPAGNGKPESADAEARR